MSLPPKNNFYNTLAKKESSDEDSSNALWVWDTFQCETLSDYHDLYVEMDMLLLANVFEQFRKTCLRYHSLDPCQYFTSPR